MNVKHQSVVAMLSSVVQGFSPSTNKPISTHGIFENVTEQ